MPERWVLKPNNSSGRAHVGTGQVDAAAAAVLAAKTADWLDRREFVRLREWAYSKARRDSWSKTFIGAGPKPPTDYKIFVFDGVVRFILVSRGRNEPVHLRTFFTADVGADHGAPRCSRPIRVSLAPANLERLVEVAADLGRGFDHVRGRPVPRRRRDLVRRVRGVSVVRLRPDPAGRGGPRLGRSLAAARTVEWRATTSSSAVTHRRAGRPEEDRFEHATGRRARRRHRRRHRRQQHGLPPGPAGLEGHRAASRRAPLPNPGGSTGHASNFIFLIDHSKEMTAFTLDSVRQYKELGVFTESGGIEVARTPERMEELKRRMASSRSWGIEPPS